MTNILVPTDFTPASLRLAEGALRECALPVCNIVLFHAFAAPDAFDALGGRRSALPDGLLTDAFRLACQKLKEQQGRALGKIFVRTMTGDTRALFRNFIDANDIDLVYCPEEFRFVAVHARSLDPKPFFEKCGVPLLLPASERAMLRDATDVFTAPRMSA